MATLDILLIEDNAADADLIRAGLEKAGLQARLRVAQDGLAAMDVLAGSGSNRDEPLPDLIMLDLNLPGKDGREILAEIKSDPHLMRIPVIVLTGSGLEADVTESYNSYANCFVAKPKDLEGFERVAAAIENFWLNVAVLPPSPKH